MVTQIRYFLLSLCLHGAFIAVCYISLNTSNTGNQSLKIMRAYLFHASTIGVNKKTTNTSKSEQSHHLSTKQGEMTIKKSTPIHAKQQIKKSRSILNAGVHSLLLEKLHDAVADKLIYPSSAAFLHLSGTTVVSFVLLPSGEIKNIKVVSKSHSAILDEAAIASLHAIAPFSLAKKYLTRMQRFTIPIKFEK